MDARNELLQRALKQIDHALANISQAQEYGWSRETMHISHVLSGAQMVLDFRSEPAAQYYSDRVVMDARKLSEFVDKRVAH